MTQRVQEQRNKRCQCRLPIRTMALAGCSMVIAGVTATWSAQHCVVDCDTSIAAAEQVIVDAAATAADRVYPSFDIEAAEHVLIARGRSLTEPHEYEVVFTSRRHAGAPAFPSAILVVLSSSDLAVRSVRHVPERSLQSVIANTVEGAHEFEDSR